MAEYVYAGLLSVGSLVLENTDGSLIPAADATVTFLNSDSDVPTYYTDRTKADTTTPDFVTDSTGIAGPFFVDPGSYSYTVVDSGGHTHPASGAYECYVGPDAAEPTVNPVNPGETAHTLVTGVEYQNTEPYPVMFRIPVTYTALSGAAATLQVGVSAATIGSAGPTEVSFPENSLAAIEVVTRVLVPAGFYIRADVVNAVIAAGGFTPVVA